MTNWQRYDYVIRREAVAQTCSVKQLFLEISQNSQKSTCARASFLIKLQAWGLLWIFVASFAVNFAKIFRTPFLTEQHLFLQNTSAGCFCQESLNWNNQADADVSQNKTKYVRFENQVIIYQKKNKTNKSHQ